MFSQVAEKKTRTVQLVLFVGWLTLIASLFWDPITLQLTRPEAVDSAFRIKSTGVPVQGTLLVNEPYELGARVFWAMVVPILPLFLIVFGHEAWRRICPLSFASQIPRRLGFNRKKEVLQRRTGRVERSIVLIKRNSWLQRNTWYVQGGLLYIGLCARLLFINSERMVLGLFLLGVITAAIVVGYLWGGKTWCNYICPVNVVQKIYTEPRGLLESSPHLTRPALSQSVCRTPTLGGDKQSCVGCTVNCGDIDLEKSYWESIDDPKRRHVYYMFWGLVIGFYGYYYLYSGNWDYYFSGIWTHEKLTAAKLFGPGLYILGRPIPIPKLVAVPLVLGACCAATLWLGLTLEKLYRQMRKATKPIPEGEILNHCLCFSAYLSINTFYLFGGRPNLLLLPPTVTRCIDILIVALTTLWFWQAVQRTPFRFRRESLASSLLEQLRRLKVDVSKYLDGRTLDELKPDEVYVLTKVLPAFSQEQKLEAYRQILDDAIATGKTSSAVSLELLHEMRMQMNISDEEHRRLLEALGMSSTADLDAQRAASHEKYACIQNYTEIAGSAVCNKVEAGRTLDAALSDPEIVSTTRILRASFQISDGEHEVVLDQLGGPGGFFLLRIAQHLEQLKGLLSARFCMHSFGMSGSRSKAISRLLIGSIDKKVLRLVAKVLAIIRALGNGPEARWSAFNTAALAGEAVYQALEQPVDPGADLLWVDAFDVEVLHLLQGAQPDAALVQAPPEGLSAHTFREVIRNGVDLAQNLHFLAQDGDPFTAALVITAFAESDPDTARALAAETRNQADLVRNRLLDETVRVILDGSGSDAALAAHPTLRITAGLPHEPPQTQRFTKPFVTIGRSPDNDVCVASGLLSPHHLTVERQQDGFVLSRHGHAAVFVDGVACTTDCVPIPSGARLDFANGDEPAPSITMAWDALDENFIREDVDTLGRMLYLAGHDSFAQLDLPSLAVIAGAAEIRHYPCGAILCHAGAASSELLLLHSGEAKRHDEGSPRSTDRYVQEGALVGEPGSLAPWAHTLSVCSDIAVVVAVANDELLWQRMRLKRTSRAAGPEAGDLTDNLSHRAATGDPLGHPL
jgi:pSer/pThr/pTyr-binding forkhead associated (FHA) protein